MSNERPATAQALLERAEADWPRILGSAHHVGLRHFDEHTPAGWRYRDLVAHLAGWHRIAAEDIETVRGGGEPPDRADADAVNAELVRRADGRSAHELLAELGASWERLREVVASLADADLALRDGWVVDKVAWNTWEHYDEHRDELLAGRPQTVQGFLARLEDDWTVMRSAVEALGVDGLDRPTGTDWRYRDLVAHACGWLRDGVTRLDEVRVDPDVVFRPVDVDATNASNVAARGERSNAELLRELDGSYRALREAVSGLRDEELADRRISGFLAVRSYLHVDEHLPELEAATRLSRGR